MLPYFVNNRGRGQGQATPQGCTLQIPCTDPRQKHSSQGILSISPPCLEPSLPILPAEMESSYSSAMPMQTDMMSQFLGDEAHGHHCFAYEQQDESMEAMAAMFLPGLDTDSNSSSSCLNYDVPPQCWPQPQPGHSSSVTSFLDPAHGYESFEFPVMDPFLHAEFQSHCTDIPYLGGEDPSPLDGNCAPAGGEEAANDHTPVTNKRKSRAATTASKKAKKAGKKDFTSNDIEGDDTYVIDPQSSSSCTSEDGDLDGNAKSSSKKTGTRASRGAATDPQSLYARKRRERINERLKTLQNLVPNGTKVDISTMLEEAVEYVKFMQLQIKLLSSDEMWMYAPLAYNGINVSSLEMHIAALQK